MLLANSLILMLMLTVSLDCRGECQTTVDGQPEIVCVQFCELRNLTSCNCEGGCGLD